MAYGSWRHRSAPKPAAALYRGARSSHLVKGGTSSLYFERCRLTSERGAYRAGTYHFSRNTAIFLPRRSRSGVGSARDERLNERW